MIQIIRMLIVPLVLALCACSKNVSQITIVNNSSEKISKVLIKACTAEIEFINVPPSGKADGEHQIDSDCSYEVYIDFSSDRKIVETLGYVTPGFNYDVKFIVRNDDVELESEVIKAD